MPRRFKSVVNAKCARIIVLLFTALSIQTVSGNTNRPNAAIEIYRQILSDEAVTKVLEFLKTTPFPQKQKESLLDRSRPEDKIELKRLLSLWNAKDFQVHAEMGTVIVATASGHTVAEISKTDDEQIVINQRPFRRPPTGSVFEALRKHLKSKQASRSPFRLVFPEAQAFSEDAAQLAVLPAYLYIAFSDANETPAKSHSAQEEAVTSSAQLNAVVMPDKTNALAILASRHFSDTKSSVSCDGNRATGIVRLAEELYRFESRENGDVVILPPFTGGAAVLLKPSRVDLGQASQMISDLVARHQQDPSVESAISIIDGPARRICERLQLIQANARSISMCDRLYEKQISIEGRCARLDRGPARSECLRTDGSRLPGHKQVRFEQDLLAFIASEAEELKALGKSVESTQIVGRRMFLHQCLDEAKCELTHAPVFVDTVQPSTGKELKSHKQLLAFRHRSTGGLPLVKYACHVQNETCAILSTTDAALRLPPKDLESLRAKIAKSNRGQVWNKSDFLQQASALRPLGRCCASADCKAKLQGATDGKLKFFESKKSKSERTSP